MRLILANKNDKENENSIRCNERKENNIIKNFCSLDIISDKELRVIFSCVDWENIVDQRYHNRNRRLNFKSAFSGKSYKYLILTQANDSTKIDWNWKVLRNHGCLMFQVEIQNKITTTTTKRNRIEAYY